jgi:hypothetical protein
LLVYVGEGTAITNELVDGFVTFTIPPWVILVFGVAAGTVGELMVRLGYVPVIEEGPTLVKVGEGTLTTNELVFGLDTFTIPPCVMLVLGVEAIVALVTTVP